MDKYLGELLTQEQWKRESKILTYIKTTNLNSITLLDKNKNNSILVLEKLPVEQTLSQLLLVKNLSPDELVNPILEILKLHENNISHGNLTTEKLVMTKSKKWYIIGFSYAKFSRKIEDKGNDINNLLKCVKILFPDKFDIFVFNWKGKGSFRKH